MNNHITDVPGIKVGHQQNETAQTGCTVVVTDQGAIGGVDVRGSAPGTRETDLLATTNTVDQVHSILLTGGSAFGLAAADGVMQALEEDNIGFKAGPAQVPIVPAAVLFDLDTGDATVRPGAKMGYQAVKNADANNQRTGRIGAGAGCTVGKILGPKHASPAGLGSASLKLTPDTYLGGLVAVNAFGEILNQQQEIIAGATDEKGDFVNTYQTMKQKAPSAQGQNTTLGVIATNAKLTSSEANKLAQIAHNGYAQQIRPVHTMFDGDTIFSLSTGEQKVEFNLLLAAASNVISQAIVNAIYSSRTS